VLIEELATGVAATAADGSALTEVADAADALLEVR
jgi:hypothetical protein